MSKLSDEKLIARANHAQRNLTVLAVLVSGGTVLSLVMAFQADGSRATALKLGCAALLLISAGYWVLAKAAKRGNPNSVGIVVVLMALHVVTGFVSRAMGGTGSMADSQPMALQVIVPLVVIAALVSSRTVLVELRKRDLWDGVFGQRGPSDRLCVIGGTLLVLGFVASHLGSAGAERAVQEVQKEREQAQQFLAMINGEEKAFSEAMSGLSSAGLDRRAALQTALTRVEELERKAQEISESAAEFERLSSILQTYRDGVQLWKKGLTLLGSAAPDTQLAQEALELGDSLRKGACQEFDKRYAGKR
jgi:hypothetical protein